MSSWSTITNEDGKQAKIRKEASYLNTSLAEHHIIILTNVNISGRKGRRERGEGMEAGNRNNKEIIWLEQ